MKRPSLPQLQRVRKFPGSITHLEVNRESTLLIVAGDFPFISVIELPKGGEISALPTHSEVGNSATFLNGSQRLAVTSPRGKVTVYNIATGQSISETAREHFASHTDHTAILASSSQDVALVGDRNACFVELLDLYRGKTIDSLSFNGPTPERFALSPDERQVAFTGYNLSMLFYKPWQTLDQNCSIPQNGWTYDLQFLDAVRIAVATEDPSIKIWNSELGTITEVLEGHTKNVKTLSYIRDKKWLLSGSSDKSVCFWDLNIGSEMWRLSCGSAVTSIVVVSDPLHLYIGTHEGSLFYCDLRSFISASPKADQIRRSIHYTNAKVILVGETSTGKTCLARALMKEPFKPQESTHGMKVWSFHSETVQQDNGVEINRETMLWDLAGQVDYQIVHQLFLDESVLGLVMFDPTHPENPFAGVEQWERALTRVAGDNCARLLIAGRVDRGYPTATEKDIEAFRRLHGFEQFVATSAKTGQGINEVREAIHQAIRWELLPVTSSPELWKQIREYILKRRNGRYVLTTSKALRAAFRRQHKGVEFTEADFDTVIKHAQAQGIIWRMSFGDHVLMKPELLNSYAAAVVRTARKHLEGLGCVSERDVLEARIDFEDMKRLSRDTERRLLYAVLELFLSREVALRGGPNDELIVFPSKFNRMLPDIPLPPMREVAYRFAGAIEDIYTTLAVRLYYSDAFTLKDLWKNAAEFRDSRGKCCGFELVQPEEGQGVIFAFFQDQTSVTTKVLFLRFIHEHLHKRASQDSVRRERIYRCPNCAEEVKDRMAISVRLERGRKTIPCLYCDETIQLTDSLEAEFGDVTLLQRLREMEEEVDANRGRAVGVIVADAKQLVREFDVFLAHNSIDKSQVETIGKALRERGINPWLDIEQIPPGRWFQDVIQQAVQDVKSAAIFIGRSGLGRWQVVELRAFISQCVERNIPVIPVLLPGVKKIPKELVFLNEFNWVRFENQLLDKEMLDSLVWGITGKHPKRQT